MIDKDTMLAQANLKMANAPNEDWHNRGTLTLTGELEEHDICDYDKKVFGKATVGFYKFEIPHKSDFRDSDDSQFIGFILAVAKIGNKTIAETQPVIGELDPEDLVNLASMLSHRFCPQCNKLDSVKQRSRRAGPECVHVTYYCKCGYEDYDVFD